MTQINLKGWNKYSIWDNSTEICNLYTRRCQKIAEEMTAHKQAALLLRPLINPGDSLLDVGCGSGYFFHALERHQVKVEYYGLDASEKLINIGRQYMPQFNLVPERLIHGRIEDLEGAVDHITCINVLSNVDNYHRLLERMLKMARKTVILRESLSSFTNYSYVQDKFLDEGIDLKVYVNTYNEQELSEFIRAHDFSTELITDEYTGGKPQNVIGYDHYWKFVLANRNNT